MPFFSYKAELKKPFKSFFFLNILRCIRNDPLRVEQFRFLITKYIFVRLIIQKNFTAYCRDARQSLTISRSSFMTEIIFSPEENCADNRPLSGIEIANQVLLNNAVADGIDRNAMRYRVYSTPGGAGIPGVNLDISATGNASLIPPPQAPESLTPTGSMTCF
ncbi:hypothetical protein ABK905_02160 [Acerihabitans sp. KWT182]|uniref:Uncharacterized protein n=1 Tax=Acerihabitans sp. KWT182 TaxID=3157919 RepID=A0AAU7QAL5_9GAMM